MHGGIRNGSVYQDIGIYENHLASGFTVNVFALQGSLLLFPMRLPHHQSIQVGVRDGEGGGGSSSTTARCSPGGTVDGTATINLWSSVTFPVASMLSISYSGLNALSS